MQHNRNANFSISSSPSFHSEGLLGVVVEVKLRVFPMKAVLYDIGSLHTEDVHAYIQDWLTLDGANAWLIVTPTTTFVETRKPVQDPWEHLSPHAVSTPIYLFNFFLEKK